MKTYCVYVAADELDEMVIAGRYEEKDAAVAKVAECLGPFVRVEVFEVEA